jgi:hypothetical protein
MGKRFKIGTLGTYLEDQVAATLFLSIFRYTWWGMYGRGICHSSLSCLFWLYHELFNGMSNLLFKHVATN